MRIRNSFIMLIVLATIILLTMGSVYGAPKAEKSWTVPLLGTTQVPSGLEIVDAKDVLLDIIKFNEEMDKKYLGNNYKSGNAKTMSAEKIEETFAKYKFSFYELAFKNNAAYNIAFLFIAKIPDDRNIMSRGLFNKLKNADQSQQTQVYKLVTDSMEEIYAKAPELKNYFKLEVLEFYPFEYMVNNNVEIVSAGGSIVLKAFKIIDPSAIKLYLIKKDATDFYVMGVLNSGPDRKMWDNMTKEMLSQMQFSHTN